MERVIVRIIARHNSADDFATAFGQEQFRVAMFIEGMTLSIEKLFALDDQWWHPGGIVFVNAPGKTDESVAVRARPYLRNFNLGHDWQNPNESSSPVPAT